MYGYIPPEYYEWAEPDKWEVRFCDRCGCNYLVKVGHRLPCVRADGSHTTEKPCRVH